jgi:hypothetical protein
MFLNPRRTRAGVIRPAHDLADLGRGHLGLIVVRASRMASSTAVHEVRPGSSAAMTEDGRPGIICACPFPRQYTGQDKRSALVAAPGRSQLLTPAASTSRPSAARGKVT